MSSGSFLLGNTQTVQAHTSLDKAEAGPLRPGWAIIIGFAGIILRLKELNHGIR